MPELKMPDINNVLIAGNVSSEPTLRKTANGTSVANFHIASHRKYKDNSGIWRESMCQVGVVAWQNLAKTCATTLKVGSSVLVDGELQSKSWKSDDGSSKSVVEIRARRIQFLEPNSAPDIEEVSTDTAATPEELSQDKLQKIEPTEFDFGYQDLKI